MRVRAPRPEKAAESESWNEGVDCSNSQQPAESESVTTRVGLSGWIAATASSLQRFHIQHVLSFKISYQAGFRVLKFHIQHVLCFKSPEKICQRRLGGSVVGQLVNLK